MLEDALDLLEQACIWYKENEPRLIESRWTHSPEQPDWYVKSVAMLETEGYFRKAE